MQNCLPAAAPPPARGDASAYSASRASRSAFSRRASSSSFFAVSAAPGACWTESGAMPEILGMCGRDVEAWKAIPEGIVRALPL